MSLLTNRLDNIYIEHKKETEVLKKSMKSTKAKKQINQKTTNVTNNVQINNQNIQLNIVDYGKEDLSFLTDDNIREILLNGLRGVVKYVEFVYCDKNKAEYRNIYISNSRNKNGSIHVFVDNGWQSRNKNVIDTMRDRGIDFMIDKYIKMMFVSIIWVYDSIIFLIMMQCTYGAIKSVKI